MEADIKILKEFIRIYEEIDKKSDDFYFNKSEIPVEIIENILNRLEQLEKENKELKENYKIILADRKRLEELLLLSDEDYIPKSKIEDKIKELENTTYAECIEANEEDIELLKSILEE